MTWLDTFLKSPTGLAFQSLLVGSILVFLLGVCAAVRDGTFNFQYIDAFVRSTVMGRVVPVFIVLVVGYLSGNDVVTGAGVIAAGVVAAGMIASALASLAQLTQPKVVSAAANPPPTA